MPKKRIPIPKAIAAKALFASDRTCCVCRIAGKRVQIHHVDDDPSNNEPSNLAVLCFECHGDTQTTGGFGRQLDADQVLLYRDDWHRIIANRRVQDYREAIGKIESESSRIKYLTSLTERLRENQDYITLANIYANMGNNELRDKYIELALEGDSPDWLIIDLRGLQSRQDLIPVDVADRRLNQQRDNGDWSQRARTLVALGRYVEAAHDYVESVLNDLESGNEFSAAFYLKELYKTGIVNRLFEKALRDFEDEGDIWWQIRSMQELGWHSEIDELVLANKEYVRESGNPLLMSYLLRAQGDEEGADRASAEHIAARKIYGDSGGVVFLVDRQEDDGDSPDDEPPSEADLGA
jgi:tetratricopeptide (TPR) repeat protein